jgi:hypothetical protein
LDRIIFIIHKVSLKSDDATTRSAVAATTATTIRSGDEHLTLFQFLNLQFTRQKQRLLLLCGDLL